MLAAQRGISEAVQALLEAGAAVDLASSNGVTALHLAAGYGHEAVVRQLLVAGANPRRVDVVIQ